MRGRFTDRGLARLRGLDGLFGLDLDAAYLRTTLLRTPTSRFPRPFDHARAPRYRGELRNVDDTGVAALPDFPALTELMPMDIPDAGYRHIGHCAELVSLVLMYCRDTTDAATEQITGLSRLTNYFASYTQITDRTPEILSRMDSLERVTFDGCAGLTNDGIAALARLPRLRELRISGQRITSGVADAFPGTVTVHYSL
ncbi:MAG: hypothetical protein ABIR58_06875 [Gemmatimonadaceae bacterium]